MSIYQQTPIVVGGGLFPIAKIELKKAAPRKEIKRTVRYWDKAGSTGSGAYTAGVLMHYLKDNSMFIEDIKRGQWSALDREKIIKQTTELDARQFKSYKVWIEQEPGSGGKESAENTIKLLMGYTVEAEKVTGYGPGTRGLGKEFRAEPFAAQVQAGNVSILAADWSRAFLEELEQFPSGKYKDQVDASSGAFNKLTLGPQYDDSMSWIDGKGV
jgi:predicted phage terminase large subunit-like protein